MRLIDELVEFAIRNDLLTEDLVEKLKSRGVKIPDNYVGRKKPRMRREVSPPLEIDIEDVLEAGSIPRSLSPDRRHKRIKNHSGRKELTWEQLEAIVQMKWDELAKKFPRYQSLWDSWKKGKLEQILADGFTLNDVYAVLSVELADCGEFSESVQAEYSEFLLLKQVIGKKFVWGLQYPLIVRMMEFTEFQEKLFQEIRRMYETDRERFASLSSQNGKLTFPYWEKSVQTDVTSMQIWMILNLTGEPVVPGIVEEVMNWKTSLEIARKFKPNYVKELVANLENRDWSSLTVITDQKIENTVLKSVVIPKEILEIKNSAFAECETLTSVVIHEDVNEIGDHAFFRCTSLEAVEIPDGVTDIGGYAFSTCTSLKSAVIPKGLKVIREETFSRCISLPAVVIPENVTEIQYAAFAGCWSLRSVDIPESVTSIGKEAFIVSRPEKMLLSTNGKILLDVPLDVSDKFVVPKGVEAIGPCVFCHRRSLTSVEIPEGVKKIGYGAFCGCTSLKYAKIPQSVKMIENCAFSGCANRETQIPDNLTMIGYDLFQDCSGHHQKKTKTN